MPVREQDEIQKQGRNIATHSQELLPEVIEAGKKRGASDAPSGKKTPLVEWARLAGKKAEYDLIYRQLSHATHTTASSIEEYIIVDDLGDIGAFKIEPDPTAHHHAWTCALVVVQTLEAVVRLFELKMLDEVKNIMARLSNRGSAILGNPEDDEPS